MIEGVLALIGIVVYLFFIAREERKNTDEEEEERPKLSTRAIVFFLIGMALIPISAHFTVEAMVNIAQYLEVGNSFISQTALAIGTSLPELFVSVAAVRKAKFDIALGNVIGSNIFNTFIVMGVPALITTLTIPDGIRVFSLPVMLVATLLMILFMLDKKIKRWEGIILLIAYIGFIGYLITHNLI